MAMRKLSGEQKVRLLWIILKGKNLTHHNSKLNVKTLNPERDRQTHFYRVL